MRLAIYETGLAEDAWKTVCARICCVFWDGDTPLFGYILSLSLYISTQSKICLPVELQWLKRLTTMKSLVVFACVILGAWVSIKIESKPRSLLLHQLFISYIYINLQYQPVMNFLLVKIFVNIHCHAFAILFPG